MSRYDPSQELELDDPTQFGTPMVGDSVTPTPAGGGKFDIGKALSGFGRVLSATSAGMMGDNDYLARVQAQENRQTERERQAKLDEEKVKAVKREGSQRAWNLILEASKAGLFSGNKEGARAFAKGIRPQLEGDFTDGQLSEDELAGILESPDDVQSVKGAYEALARTGFFENPKNRKMFSQPGALTALNNQHKELLGQKAADEIRQKFADNPNLPKDITPAEFRKLSENAQFLTDEQKTELGVELGLPKIRSSKLIEKKEESALIEGRQAEKEAGIQARHDEDKRIQQANMNRLAGQFIEGQNRADERTAAHIGAALQRPLELGDRTAVAAMEENLNIARKLKTEFSDEERKKYVGIITNPTTRALQLVKNDPKFAKFQTLTNEVKGFAFAEGGKQLTETEKRITWGHLPVGTEFSVSDYVSNLDRTLERTESLVKRRIELATTPRSRITSPANTPTQAPAPAQAAPTMRYNPATKKVEPIK